MAACFSFATAGHILFGPGSASQVAGHAVRLGRQALLITGATPSRADRLAADLRGAGIRVSQWIVDHEPDVESVTAGTALAKKQGCDMVIGFGGGSVLDAAKAVAALVPNTGPITDYLEIIGKALPFETPPLPSVAIPTTAGTGSEVTRNAVIRSVPHRIKVSMRSPDMLPNLAVVDPELTIGLPAEATAASGCDALCQLVEAFVSSKANPLTDCLCKEGLARCARSLKRTYQNGSDLAARTDMALASLLSGLALANAGLGAVHGIAGPLGGMRAAPHGAVCARLLPGITAANVEALKNLTAESHFLDRYREVAAILTNDPKADADILSRWCADMVHDMQIPALSHWGLEKNDIPQLAAQALASSSMKGNPVALTAASLEAVIAEAAEGNG